MSAIPTNQDYHGEALPPFTQQAPPPGTVNAYCKGVSLWCVVFVELAGVKFTEVKSNY